MQFPIFIELRRSFFRRLLCPLLLLLVLASIALTPLAWPYRSALLLYVALVFVWAWRQPQLLSLRLLGPQRLDLEQAGGRWRRAEIRGGTTVFPHLIVLQVYIDADDGIAKRALSYAIFADQIPAERFRQLRLWLRLQTVGSGDQA